MLKTASQEKLISLAASLHALQLLHKMGHWRTTGETFYADHQLFNRLTDEYNEDLLIEKIISKSGPDILQAGTYAKQIADLLKRWDKPAVSLLQKSFLAETEFLKALDSTINILEASGELPTGLANFLQGVSDDHDRVIYLLKQRLTPSKTASIRVASRFLVSK